MGWLRKLLVKALDGIIGNAAWGLLLILLGLLYWLRKILQDLIFTKIEITIGVVIAIALPILVLTIYSILFYRKRWLQASGFKKEREYLISHYGLSIVSARFGLDASGAETKDVTNQIVLGLAEKGNIHLGLNLVGGKKNDPVENTPKKVYLDYIQGETFFKEFDEGHTLSINDLISNKDN